MQDELTTELLRGEQPGPLDNLAGSVPANEDTHLACSPELKEESDVSTQNMSGTEPYKSRCNQGEEASTSHWRFELTGDNPCLGRRNLPGGKPYLPVLMVDRLTGSIEARVFVYIRSCYARTSCSTSSPQWFMVQLLHHFSSFLARFHDKMS